MVIETIQKKNAAYYAKSFIGSLEYFLLSTTWKPIDIIVLNLHSTPKKFEKNFRKIIRFLLKHYDFINPCDFYSPMEGNLVSSRPKILFTFDDGLKNNLYAAKVLEDIGIRAFFFVVPNFINESENGVGRKFYLKNIRPKVNPKFDTEPEDFNALSWHDLKKLHQNGHIIGSHSMSHLLSSKDDESKLYLELVQSKEEIENKLGISINTFCSPNNTSLSVSEKARKLISEHYAYHFTTFHGSNPRKGSNQAIKRINIEAFWGLGTVKFALGQIQKKRLGA